MISDGSVDVSHSAISAADRDASRVRRLPDGGVHPADFRVGRPASDISAGTVDDPHGEVVEHDTNFLSCFHSNYPGSICGKDNRSE